MKTFALCSLLFISTALLAQDDGEPVYVVKQRGGYLIYGDLTYTQDFRGVKQLMETLALQKSPMYKAVAPRYVTMRHRRSGAALALTGGIVVGTGFFVRWISRQGGEPVRLGTRPNYTSVAVGSLLMIGGAVLYRAIYNPHRELLDFTNDFNQRTEGVKLRLTGGIQPAGERWCGALGLQLEF